MSSAGVQSLDGLVQPTFVSSRFIFLNQAFAGHFVDLRHGGPVTFFGGFCITCVQRLDDLLHRRAHAGFQCDVVLAPSFALPRTLGCRFDICHSYNPLLV